MDLIKSIKETLLIEQEIGEQYTLNGKGPVLTTEEHDSLKIWTQSRSWFWFSRNKGGDIFDWVQMREGCTFARALEILAEKAGVPFEAPSPETEARRRTSRKRRQVLNLAAQWLRDAFWSSHVAKDYALGRGWDEETCRREGLGYMPPPDEMSDQPSLAALLREKKLLDSQAARAVLSIPSGMLVYVHRLRGQVEGLSGRSIRERRHYRLPSGDEPWLGLYHNHPHNPRDGIILLVEGPADAVSVGQLRYQAVALCGVRPGRRDRSALPAVTHVALDNDEAGRARAMELGLQLGPTTRIVEWRLHGRPQKDANAFLLALGGRAEMSELLKRAPRAIEVLAEEVENATPGEREPALRRFLDAYADLDELSALDLKPDLARVVDGPRQLDRMLKARHREKENESDEPTPLVYYSAGGERGGLLWEECITWKPDGSGHALYVVRNSDGTIAYRPQVEVGDMVYRPYPPRMGLIAKKVVLFPERAEPFGSQQALLRKIQTFIHRYLDVDPFYERLAAYYVAFTWLYDLFQTLPYLRALGDYGTGKSRFLQTIGALCYRPMFISGAATISPIFRIIDMFRGTLVIDEADFASSDADAEIIKILNVGYFAGGVVLRSEKDPGSPEEYWPAAKEVYGPKILATRHLFSDRATESRCLTRRMVPRRPRPSIPFLLSQEFWDEATALRNQLLMYRIRHHRPTAVDPTLADESLEPRLNQVTMALKATVDDPAMLADIDAFVRSYNQTLIADRQMTLPAIIVQALADIYYDRPTDLYGDARDFSMKGICDVARPILADIDPDERLSPRRVGSILSEALGLTRRGEHSRTRRAIVQFDEQELITLMRRYGIRARQANE